MLRLSPAISTLRRTAACHADRAWAALAAGVALVLVAWVKRDTAYAVPLMSAGGTLAALAAGLRLLGARRTDSVMPRSRLRTLCEDAPGACIVTDIEGRVLIANAAAMRRVATARGQSLAPALTWLFADPFRMVADLVAAASRGLPVSEERRGPHGLTRLTVEPAEAGLFLWHFDGTEPTPAEGALPMLRLNPAGEVLSLNAAARGLLGHAPTNLAELRGAAPPEAEEIAIDTPDGTVLRRLLSVPTEEGQSELYLVPAAPTLHAKPTPEGLLDALPVAILHMDVDGTVRLDNARARALLGPAEGGAMNLCDRLDGLGRPVRDWLTETAEGRASNSAEVLRVVRSDKEIFVQVALARLSAGGLVAVLHDVTEMKTLEAQFTQSQKMQAIGQLAGGVAHDFNNLLTAISGHCDLLMLRHDAGDPDYGDLVQIHQNANRAASLVSQLLAFSRKQTLSPEVLDLRDILGELAHLLDRLVGEKMRLRMRHAPALPPIRADKRQLEQVVMNLVVNARDAMAETGGEIRLETEAIQLTTELQRDRAVVPPGPYALIRVRDEGTGIPPDRLTKIFEPFYTTKRPGEGTGLGLSTVYGIVKQTGGFIFVDSTVGQGSCFTIYLPAHRGGANAAPAVAVAVEEETSDSGVVLLVEDEAPVRSFAARALRMRGNDVIEAESGEEALEILEDRDLVVDVFVTDVVMPGLDGPGWVSEALKTRPGTRVVFVSGYAEDSVSEIRSRIPKSIYLPKPFSLADLTTTVQKQLKAAASDHDD
ncbi:sensory box histidine kinase/response regulator [Rhodovulum sp. P5]|uniref:ATP-binding response regulator n=1 Tax=Rhodovulum sp. P5 TaxID=1564506 RepID=UPI0009C26B1F|nr:PAS domain-containing sensor histidine kinase [Rhodovulum sp. P5]ARE41674.1 sensory box histidine kinase/response regulator [Rhodovulum sp. P5]